MLMFSEADVNLALMIVVGARTVGAGDGQTVAVSHPTPESMRNALQVFSRDMVGRWLAIDLAPKDGTSILVGRKGFYPQMASWPVHIANPTWPTLFSRDAMPVRRFAKPTHFAWINEPEEST